MDTDSKEWLERSPFRQLRRQLGLTQAQLARRIDCAVSAVLYNEQGLYTQPLKVIEDYFCDELDVSRERLRKSFFAYQRLTRKQNKRMFLLPPVDKTKNPIRDTVEFNNYAITRFCKSFCVPPVLLRDPKLMTNYLQQTLTEAGFTPVQIEELSDRLKEYNDWVRS